MTFAVRGVGGKAYLMSILLRMLGMAYWDIVFFHFKCLWGDFGTKIDFLGLWDMPVCLYVPLDRPHM